MLNSLMSDPGLVLLILFIFMLVCRVPIAISLGLSAAIVSWLFDMGIDMLPYNFFAGVAKVPLLAIPFFILAGFIMESAGIAARIVRLVENLVGDMTGGLAIATVAVATFWGAVSGSGPATVAALGLILIPAMVKNGYDKAFAAANVSVTSGLAIVIPPSIAFIVYGGIADASVPALFAAGIVPGLLVAGFLMLTVYLISKKRGYRGLPRQESTWLVFKEPDLGRHDARSSSWAAFTEESSRRPKLQLSRSFTVCLSGPLFIRRSTPGTNYFTSFLNPLRQPPSLCLW